MNNQSNILKYPFQLLASIDQDKIPIGHRLIRITFRSDADKAKGVGKKASQGIIIPALIHTNLVDIIGGNIPESIESKWIIINIQSVQDGIIRRLCELGSTHIISNDIGVSAILAEISSQINTARAESTRLSGKSIEEWYEAHIKEPLAKLFATRYGIAKNDIKILKITNAYLVNFQSLAGKGRIKEDVAINLLKAIDLANGVENDPMKVKLLARIEVLTTTIDDTELDLNI